jgi:hypothetical protein
MSLGSIYIEIPKIVSIRFDVDEEEERRGRCPPDLTHHPLPRRKKDKHHVFIFTSVRINIVVFGYV